MRGVTEMQYAHTTRHSYTHTHTHTQTLTNSKHRKSAQVTLRGCGLRPIHSSTTTSASRQKIAFGRIQTHTMRRSPVDADVIRYTQNKSAESHLQHVKYQHTLTHKYTQKKIMFWIDNSHLYRSAFFIPKWLCGAMDFINGSFHSILLTACCNHYSKYENCIHCKTYAWSNRICMSFTQHA